MEQASAEVRATRSERLDRPDHGWDGSSYRVVNGPQSGSKRPVRSLSTVAWTKVLTLEVVKSGPILDFICACMGAYSHLFSHPSSSNT